MAGISMKFKQIDKTLKKNGFIIARVKGDHIIYKREAHETVVIPRVKCNELILEKYFKQFEIKY